ncbi:DUF6894 family protein [Bradyrhizobium betae]|uniref:DUF6894 family protein n=1 Tax=Bradyrhizobium betae TaxID=244734 RepID=UPI0026980BC2
MKRFYFDLAGAFTACDKVGHQCASSREAKEHARFIAHRIGTDKSPFAQPGNCIRVRDESGAEIFKAPIHAGFSRLSGRPPTARSRVSGRS